MRTFRNYPESSYFVVQEQPIIRSNKTYTAPVPPSFSGFKSGQLHNPIGHEPDLFPLPTRERGECPSTPLPPHYKICPPMNLTRKRASGLGQIDISHLLKTSWLCLVTLPRWVFAALVALTIGVWFLLANAATKPETVQLFAFEGSFPRALSNVQPVKNVGNNVVGSPTITPAKIDAVLRRYNSPASGIGQSLYNLGVKYGIDPAYALAFFVHESTAGTQGVAAITKSIGNIRCTAGYECYQTSGNGSFRRYTTWEAGAEDWYRLIKDQYVGKWGLTTLEQIIPVYAPSADRNNPTAYIRQVADTVQSWRQGG